MKMANLAGMIGLFFVVSGCEVFGARIEAVSSRKGLRRVSLFYTDNYVPQYPALVTLPISYQASQVKNLKNIEIPQAGSSKRLYIRVDDGAVEDPLRDKDTNIISQGRVEIDGSSVRLLSDKGSVLAAEIGLAADQASNYFVVSAIDDDGTITMKNGHSDMMFENVAKLKSGNLVCPNCDLRNADLREINLRNAYLDNASLEGANLEGVILHRASLRGVNFRGANLTNAYVEEANLDGADFHNANIQGAAFKGSTGRFGLGWAYGHPAF
jgi:hypothetical protein